MEIIDKIKSLARDNFSLTQKNRHHLHQHPELSFEEFATAEYVIKELEAIGISNIKQIGITGVTAIIAGKSSGKTIALRADLDALPIQEQNEVAYKSEKEGVMHACGHDVHTSCLLGAARILFELREYWNGEVKLIFQPGEEKSPGGASVLIKEGVLENPSPSHMLGQHVMPYIPVGKVGFRSGKYMASNDEIYLKVVGKGGHAAMPESLVDPIIIASQILINLQQIASRKSSPKTPTVLSFGDIHGYGATNVIPDEVNIAGTFRTFDEDWRKEAHAWIKQIAEQTAKASGGSCEVTIVPGYPFLVNNEDLTRRSKDAATAYLGAENIEDLDLWMGAEDFAFYSHQLPACFYRLGTRNEEKGITAGVHTPTFDIDEEALEIGSGLMAWLAISELEA
jgi:amidohydrolase